MAARAITVGKAAVVVGLGVGLLVKVALGPLEAQNPVLHGHRAREQEIHNRSLWSKRRPRQPRTGAYNELDKGKGTALPIPGRFDVADLSKGMQCRPQPLAQVSIGQGGRQTTNDA